MRTTILIVLLFSTFISNGQYSADFSIPNRGIINGPCGVGYSSCSNFDFTSVDWIISGDLTGIDTEGFFTQGGDLVTSDTDERACWESPTLDISSVATSSITVIFTIPTGASWESFSSAGSIDFMDVTYSINGGTPILAPNISGCPASGHTVCNDLCGDIVGPMTYTIDVIGIVGDELKIYVCIDTNGSGDIGIIESVTVPEAGTVLPITWNTFTANKQDENVLLNWSTYEEINNMLFEIERSHDGRSFEKIAEIFAKTDASNGSDYTLMDNEPIANSINYYRLRQVDYDGKSEYSVVRSISNLAQTPVFIYPTVISDKLHIKSINSLSNIASIKIYSTLGKLEKTIFADQLSADPSIDCSMLLSGRYWVLFVKNDGIVSNQKATFVKI